MKRSAMLMLGALTLSACSASNTETPSILPASTPADFVINPHGETSTDASREAMDVLTDAEARAVLSPRSPLADAEAGARIALASADGLSENAASELRQTVASLMIQRHLAAPTQDTEAIGRYTQMLLDEESPNAHLLAEALPVLKVSWGEARVHAAAERGATEAAAFLEKTCPACNASARARGRAESVQSESGAVDQQKAIQNGIVALQSI